MRVTHGDLCLSLLHCLNVILNLGVSWILWDTWKRKLITRSFFYTFWTKEITTFGQQVKKARVFFDHLRSGLKLRLNELSTTPEYYTLPAQVNILHFFEGLDKKLTDKAKEEGWDDKSCESVPWSVYSTICGVLI